MKIKFLYIAVFAFCSFCVFSSAKLKTSGSHQSSTGAPGDNTCAQAGCHTDAVVQPGDLVNSLVFGNDETSYVPGQTYDMTAKVEKAGILKFGFQLVALTASNNMNTGTLSIIQSSRTQLQNGQAPIADRKYITHTTAGTAPTSAGVGRWAFRWKAPSTDVGPITFWYATNATNNNNQSSGDNIYLSSFTVMGPTGFSEIEKSNLNVSYLSQTSEIIVRFPSVQKENSELVICDLSGKIVLKYSEAEVSGKYWNEFVSIPADFGKGMYIVSLNSRNWRRSGKVMVL